MKRAERRMRIWIGNANFIDLFSWNAVWCSLFLKAIDKAVLYYILFAWIRKYAGGYHAKTYIGCTSLYLLTFSFSVFMERNLLYILNLKQMQGFEFVVMISLMITVIFLLRLKM